MKHILLTLGLLHLTLTEAGAQYAPQAGISGSDAIPATDVRIRAWAGACKVQRGLQQIGNTAGGYAQAGDSTLATGPADGTVVSLGDSGVAVLTFAAPVYNGPGADFAVFENGFLNPANGEEAFLELAFVEVSSDGARFYRFPAACMTQDTVQFSSVAGQNYMNARHLYNLAGKYISGYGTPFDLQELAGNPGLDVNRITHVRIVDAIGDIGGHSSRDAAGRRVNDPFPTAFPTGGFDLDAVGVIHTSAAAGVAAARPLAVRVFPNPAAAQLRVQTAGRVRLQLSDATGRVVQDQQASGEAVLALQALSPGIYYLTVQDENGRKWVGSISHL